MRYLFAFLFLLTACRHEEKKHIVFDEHGLSADDSVAVYVINSDYPVLGALRRKGNRYTFTPVVPFRAGQTYLAISKNDSLTFTVPVDSTVSTPRLLSSYPSCDTVPSNLLKVYLKFSEPMQEYRSSQFVALVDDISSDTIKDAFLDLKPELWNADGTVLTLWIDPGRVKQDLIPNRQLGTVLHDNHRYRLEVAKGWKSKKGAATTVNYSRKFVTASRDIDKPHIRDWKIRSERDTIVVDTKEILDWSLLNTSVSLWSRDKQLEAKSFSEVCETQLIIIPKKSLEQGIYTLKIEGILEDRAGNNLNRLFETDVTSQSDKVVNKQMYSLTFQVN